MTSSATLFIPCLVDAFYPNVAKAMVEILERLGLSLLYPLDQTCCGQPAYNAGYHREARKAALRFLYIFKNAEAIVCPSGSCVHMVRHHYLELFKKSPEKLKQAKQIAAKTYEFTEYLVEVLDITDIGAVYNGKVTYHESCHLRYGLQISKQPRQLIDKVRGCRLVEMEESDRCCGFGGSFSIKYPDISTALVDDKIDRIVATGADTVVGGDMGCLMNISGRLHRRGITTTVYHIAELLAMTSRGRKA